MSDQVGRAMRQDALLKGALAVLLDSAGGSATYSEAAYQEVAAKYGGTAELGISIDVDSSGATPVVRLSLVRKTSTESRRLI